MKRVRAADLFCGAGGTSTGLARAYAELGVGLQLVAIDHWEVAIETHSTNHPGVEHICASLESLNPRAVVPSGHLDILVASPECTHFSSARGGKPISDQKDFGLVTGQIDAYVLDIHFRMLQPHELARAMGFPDDYKFAGSREDKVRQIGNAVPVNLARALCIALLSDKAERSARDLEATA